MTESLSSRIERNIDTIRNTIEKSAPLGGMKPADISLMAVTKTVPADAVNIAVEHGIRLLGENRAQELLSKHEHYRLDGVEIHFIGHLQSNKVRQIIGKVSMIQSMDSLKLAAEIDRQSRQAEKITQTLIEVNIGNEPAKSGVHPSSLEELLYAVSRLQWIKVKGLMAIPPYDRDIKKTEIYFERMKQIYIDIKAKKMDNVDMEVLSMGMSLDYSMSIKHGANLIRLGSAIFGERTV